MSRNQETNFKNNQAMRNTDFTLDTISSLISSEISFEILSDMVKDMGLEIIDVKAA